MELIKIEIIDNTPVIDSRIVAQELGNDHASLMRLINKHLPVIEQQFGKVGFEIAPSGKTKQNQQVAHLTEDQSLFIGTLSKNTAKVVSFKAKIVSSFSALRNQSLSKLPKSEDQVLLDAFTIMNKRLEANKRELILANQTIAQQAEIVNYANRILDAVGSFPITIFAGELGYSAIALNKILKEKGVQHKVSGTWVLTAKYLNLGYTENITYPYKRKDGTEGSNVQMEWTQKGRRFIHGLLNPALLIHSTTQISQSVN